MRICMLTWKYWPGPEGGTERQCRLVSHALSAMGAEVTIVTHWTGLGTPRQETDGKVRVLRMGAVAPLARAIEWANRPVAALLRGRAAAQAISAELPRAKTPGWLTPLICMDFEKALFILSVRRYFRRNKSAFDVLHVHESHWIAGLGAELGRTLGIPVVVKEASFPVLRELDVSAPCRRKFDVLRRQACYQALTQEGADQLVEKGVAREGVFTVCNGVALSPELADTMANDRVLCVANLRQVDYWKRLSVLLAAWKEVHAQRASAILTVVGGGDARVWREHAGNLGLGESVQFSGGSGDVDSWYRKSGVFVLPSRSEGMSNALLEAQSWGLPAVVSDIPGNRAVVRDGVNGIIVPVDDAHRLAEAVIRLLDSPGERRTMGLAARRRAEQEFAVPIVAGRLLEMYRTMATRGRSTEVSPSRP